MSQKNNFTYIYILKCPETGEVRYVGKANNPKKRYSSHLNVNRTQNFHKCNWILFMKRKDLKPELQIIKRVLVSDWKYWEKYYIKYYRDKGCKLTNCTDGGDGLGFGNQTSFKKGLVSWNSGTKEIITKKCNYCGKTFNPKDKRLKYCSISHAAKDNTGFKKGFIPWNRGKPGYKVNSINCKTISEYPSLAEASRCLNVSADSISNVLCGRSKTAGGYRLEVKK